MLSAAFGLVPDAPTLAGNGRIAIPARPPAPSHPINALGVGGEIPKIPASPPPANVPVKDEKLSSRLPIWKVKSVQFQGGGSLAIEDIKKLLSGFGEPRREPKETEGEEIFGGVTFLMPLKEAKQKLGVSSQLPSKMKIAGAGFPDGLFYSAFDGVFAGHYNRLYLVTDSEEKAVCISLVDESPERNYVYPSGDAGPDKGWHTYNFVNARTKARQSLRISHKVEKVRGGVVVNSEIYDLSKGDGYSTGIYAGLEETTTTQSKRGSRSARENPHLEASRWFVPQGLVDAILAGLDARR